MDKHPSSTRNASRQRGVGSLAMAIVLLLVAVLSAYIFSYALLVQRGDGLTGTAWNRLHYKPRYRVLDNAAVQRFYYPIHAIDLEVRRSYWYAVDYRQLRDQ